MPEHQKLKLHLKKICKKQIKKLLSMSVPEGLHIILHDPHITFWHLGHEKCCFSGYKRSLSHCLGFFIIKKKRFEYEILI